MRTACADLALTRDMGTGVATLRLRRFTALSLQPSTDSGSLEHQTSVPVSTTK